MKTLDEKIFSAFVSSGTDLGVCLLKGRGVVSSSDSGLDAGAGVLSLSDRTGLGVVKGVLFELGSTKGVNCKIDTEDQFQNSVLLPLTHLRCTWSCPAWLHVFVDEWAKS